MISKLIKYILLLSSVCFFSINSFAQFALAVSPPRFEIKAKAGETIREILELNNAEGRPGSYTVKTADWIFEKDESVTLVDDLLPGSCRQWVSIEKREVTINGGQSYRYRFEVRVPEGLEATECRFALTIQGREQVVKNSKMPIPLAARVAVVVYISVGGAAPELSVSGTEIINIGGKQIPAIKVKNTGAAHGRLGGVLSGVDAEHAELEIVPSSTPILPGEVRTISLGSTKYGQPEIPYYPKFPLKLNGTLEWEDKTMELKAIFEK